MTYVFLLGTIPYALVWVVFFIFRKDLRKKLWFSSLFATIIGISGVLFVPDYWEPQFQVIPLINDLYLENILFTFFLGGVVTTFYQALFKKKLAVKKVNPLVTLIAPLLFLSYFLKPFEMIFGRIISRKLHFLRDRVKTEPSRCVILI